MIELTMREVLGKLPEGEGLGVALIYGRLCALVERWRKGARKETAKNGTTYVDYLYCADELAAILGMEQAGDVIRSQSSS